MPRVRIRVDDETITAVSNTLALREIGGEPRELSHDARIARILHRRNVLTRNDENVDRRLRIDVPERDAIIRLGDDLRRNLFAHDAAEQAILGHGG